MLALALLAVSLGCTSTLHESWQLYVIFGVLTGLGHGALNTNVVTVAVTQTTPERHHSLLTGIAASGGPFGALIIVPLFALVVQVHGWRITLGGLAVVTGLLLPFASILLYEPATIKEPVDIASSISPTGDDPGGGDLDRSAAGSSTAPGLQFRQRLAAIVTSWGHWVLVLVMTLCGFTTSGFVGTHLVALIQDRGMSETQAAVAYGVICAVAGGAMIVTGWLSDRNPDSRKAMLMTLYAVRALSFVVLYHARSVPVLYGFVVPYGLVESSTIPPLIALVKEITGAESLGLSVGVVFFWHAAGSAAGALIPGQLFMASGDYSSSILLCAGLSVATLPAIALIPGKGGQRRACASDDTTAASLPCSPNVGMPTTAV